MSDDVSKIFVVFSDELLFVLLRPAQRLHAVLYWMPAAWQCCWGRWLLHPSLLLTWGRCRIFLFQDEIFTAISGHVRVAACDFGSDLG